MHRGGTRSRLDCIWDRFRADILDFDGFAALILELQISNEVTTVNERATPPLLGGTVGPYVCLTLEPQ